MKCLWEVLGSFLACVHARFTTAAGTVPGTCAGGLWLGQEFPPSQALGSGALGVVGVGAGALPQSAGSQQNFAP